MGFFSRRGQLQPFTTRSTPDRERIIRWLVAAGVDRADASIATDYAMVEGSHAVPGIVNGVILYDAQGWKVTGLS